MPVPGRVLRSALALGLVVAVTAACGAPAGGQPDASKSSEQADAIRQLVRDAMAEQHLKGVIVSVTVDGKKVLTEAFGESLPGVPATTDMNFRNGAVAFQYVEQPAAAVRRRGQGHARRHHRPLAAGAARAPTRSRCACSRTRPRAIPTSNRTRRGSRRTTRTRTTPGRSTNGCSTCSTAPDRSRPGANWSYSHSNFMILGEVLSKIGKQPLETLLRTKVLEPMGLTHTVGHTDRRDPGPGAAHVQLRAARLLRRPGDHTVLRGRDVLEHAVGDADGRQRDHEDRRHGEDGGRRRDRQAPVEVQLRGDDRSPACSGSARGTPPARPSASRRPTPTTSASASCGPGSWIKQNPALTGSASVEGYLPSKKIAIAIVNTFDQDYYTDPDPSLPSNPANVLFQKIGAVLAPDDPPPST